MPERQWVSEFKIQEYIVRCVWLLVTVLSWGGDNLSFVFLWRLTYSHVISTDSNQEVRRNYRDAPCSNGVPTQPII